MLRENLKTECLQEGKYRCASRSLCNGGGGKGEYIQVLEDLEGNCLRAGGTEMKKTKPFTIGKLEVMNAYNKVKANKGSGGVDQMSYKTLS